MPSHLITRLPLCPERRISCFKSPTRSSRRRKRIQRPPPPTPRTIPSSTAHISPPLSFLKTANVTKRPSRPRQLLRSDNPLPSPQHPNLHPIYGDLRILGALQLPNSTIPCV